jgi:uroporphyrinogen decarboxylase
MGKREVVKLAVEGRQVPYVPWACSFTVEAAEKLRAHFGEQDLDAAIDNHIVRLGSDIGFFDDLGDERFRDVFGVVWGRRMGKDIGNVEGAVLAEATLSGYEFPDPLDRRFFEDIPEKLNRYEGCFRVFQLGFSLYERAWTLRGMENLLMDFAANPEFVHQLLGKIADYNIAQVERALEYDIDAAYFGDDWGQQRGLQMGPKIWRQFIHPQLKRMYSVVRNAGKYVFIH